MSERKLRDKLCCSKCGDWVSYDIVERKEVFKVRSEAIEIPVKVAVCTICGTDLFEPTLEGENLRRAYRTYAERHGLVTPEEIRRIREKYEVSQAVFAKILGVGKATIERYEAGALPTESISNLIRSAESLKSFEKLLEKNKENISISDYQRIKKKIEEYKTKEKTGESAESKSSFGLRELESFFAAFNRGNIDFPKLYGVTAAILKALGGCALKVKFVKLLWFIDKTYCEKYGKPLTGLVYAHLPMGPSPNKHDSLLNVLEESGTVEIQREEIKEGAEVIRIFLKDESMTKYLDEKDLKVVQEVMEKYGSYKTGDLIDLSHRDKHWLNTRDGDLIEL